MSDAIQDASNEAKAALQEKFNGALALVPGIVYTLDRIERRYDVRKISGWDDFKAELLAVYR